jgi:hypothetical protein
LSEYCKKCRTLQDEVEQIVSGGKYENEADFEAYVIAHRGIQPLGHALKNQ